jgi:molybdopterin converting factor small subunit
MKISIECSGIMRDGMDADNITMPITPETTVGDAMIWVKNRYPNLPLDGSFLITVNHEVSSLDRLLRENDRITFIPHIGGG